MNKEQNKKLTIYVLSLLVLTLFSVAVYGMDVLYMMIVSIAGAFVIEALFMYVRKKKANILNWLVTPMLFVLFVPVSVPLWLVLYGSMFAVLFGKAVFGGDDNYVFNPAMVGILFVKVSFLPIMTNDLIHPVLGNVGLNSSAYMYKLGLGELKFHDLLMGIQAGTVGEGFRLLILILGAVLIVTKTIDWKVPVVYLVSYFLFTVFGLMSSGINETTNYLVEGSKSLFVGSVMLAAFFVAPDEPALAKSSRGRIIHAIGLGFFTFIIRKYSAYADGISFAIILMSAIAPLIDKLDVPELVIEEGTTEEVTA